MATARIPDEGVGINVTGRVNLNANEATRRMFSSSRVLGPIRFFRASRRRRTGQRIATFPKCVANR
jgi:hypothetical protein